jgi:stalled ribosome rescue protein Dom34
VEEVADRNIKESADFAARFFSENNVRRVLIGGTEENLKPFKIALPKTWQTLVVGAFPMSMNATHLEVMEKAMEVGIEAEERRKARLVEAVITGSAKGKGGVVKIEDTLRALHDGRVQTLMIQDGLQVKGSKCPRCGFVTSQMDEACPYCGNAFDPIPDVVELAVRSMMRAGGEVEVVHLGNPLQEYEGIGALLRY